jgi:alkanesulfonate monooxygenase SsuD/methylene tetrahydromethanopterin reductase-like flavin-dependent oxidoreductase (luciferase family)
MRFGYGLITAQRPPDDPRTDADLYREAVERCVAAEAAGFDSAWVSEHHFLDDGYMPSLLVSAAAIAQATQRLTIGTAVLLAPLHDPLRIAEDAATVDLISGGRFVLGLGAGWRAEEFDVLGVPQSERARRMREAVRTCRGAWGPGTFEYPKGSGNQVNVTPKPAHDIPIWLGGFAPGAIARAGRIADGFLGSSSGTSGIAAFVEAKKIALDARHEAGKPTDDFTFALHVPVYVSDGDAWAEVEPYYTYLRWKYADMAQAHGSTTAKRPSGVDPAQLRATIICGSAAEVTEQVAAFADALGDATHFIFRSDFPGMPQSQLLETIDAIGSDVIGALKR